MLIIKRYEYVKGNRKGFVNLMVNIYLMYWLLCFIFQGLIIIFDKKYISMGLFYLLHPFRPQQTVDTHAFKS